MEILETVGALAVNSQPKPKYQEPAYSVLGASEGLEIRLYEPMVVAEVFVDGPMDVALHEGFHALASYIFSNKIQMTAPVLATREGSGWQVRFIMPSDRSIDCLPAPSDLKILLNQISWQTFAVQKFSGLALPNDLSYQEHLLLSKIWRSRLKTTGTMTLAFFDAPWTMPWNRRNEIMFTLDM